MSTPVTGFIVTFKHDLSEHGAERIANLLRLIDGVIDVSPVMGTPTDWIVEQRVRHDLEMKLLAVLRDKRR